MVEEQAKRKRVRGRRRMVWQSIWQDEDFRKLTREERLLLIGMITIADDAGRGRASEFTLKADVFPTDEDMGVAKVKKMRDRIGRVMGNVRIYKVEGELYFQFLKWADYQVLDHGSPSKFPSPSGEKQGELIPDDQRLSTGLSDQRRANLSQSSLTELNLTEPKGTEAAKAGRVTDMILSTDWTDQDLRDFLAARSKSPTGGASFLADFMKKKGYDPENRGKLLGDLLPIMRDFSGELIGKAMGKVMEKPRAIKDFGHYLRAACQELKEKEGG